MPSTTKSRIEKSIQDLFDRNKKITQQRIADKCKLHIASVRYWWTPELKKAVREMNHVTRASDKTVSRITKWRYTTRLTKQTTKKRIKKNRLELDTLYIEDCLHTMKRMPDNFTNLTVCSCPYDQLRTYDGYSQFNFQAIAKQLFRVTKQGGVLVWVCNDSTVKGSETGTSFRQVLYFMSLGFKLHDTMIYEKNTSSFPARRSGNRYTQIFDFMFVLSKGTPKTAKLICDKPNRWESWKAWGKKTHRKRDGTLVETTNFKNPVPSHSARNNIWRFVVGKGFITKNGNSHEHPAIFPEQLAAGHIETWSNEGDIVYDCFSGSHSTIRMAKKLKRHFIGSEINPKYAKLWEGVTIYKWQNLTIKTSRKS